MGGGAVGSQSEGEGVALWQQLHVLHAPGTLNVKAGPRKGSKVPAHFGGAGWHFHPLTSWCLP